jgi:hypothetical protein
VAPLADEFQNDIDDVNRLLEQFGNLKMLGMVTKLKFEDNNNTRMLANLNLRYL